MRKKLKSVTLLGCFLFFISLSYLCWKNHNEVAYLKKLLVEEQTKYPPIYNVIDSMTLKNFEDKIEKKEDVIVYVGRPSCSDCTKFEPKFIQMLENKKLTSYIVYLNVAELRKNEQKWDEFKEKFGIEYTPTIARFSLGKIVDKVNWTPENGTDIDEFDYFLSKI